MYIHSTVYDWNFFIDICVIVSLSVLSCVVTVSGLSYRDELCKLYLPAHSLLAFDHIKHDIVLLVIQNTIEPIHTHTHTHTTHTHTHTHVCSACGHELGCKLLISVGD